MKISEVVQYQHVDPNEPEFQQMRAQNAAARAAQPPAVDPLKTDPGLRALYDPKTLPTAAPAATQPATPTVGATVNSAAPTAPQAPVAPVAPTAPQAPSAPVAKQSWQQLYAANKDVIGANPNLIKPGQQLKMPDGSTYTVKSGDSLSKIAANFKPGSTPAAAPAQPASSKIVTPIAPQAPSTTAKPPRDNFAQANAYLDQQDAAAKQKWIDNRARANAARQRSANANNVVDAELANMDKEIAGINATPAPTTRYYVQPSKIGMNGEMDYVVVDRPRGLEVKSFPSQAEADNWIKSQPMQESLSRILTIAGVK